MYDNLPLLFLSLIFVLVVIYMFLRVKEENALNQSRAYSKISPEDIFQQVQGLVLKKDHRTAQGLALNYLENDPSFCELRHLLAKSFIDTKKEYDAIIQYQVLTKYHPDEIKLYLKIAVLAQHTKQYKKAIENYLIVTKKEPNNVIALRNLATLYMQEHQKDAAMKIYKHLLTCFDEERDKAEIYGALADIYTSQGENQLAVDNYKKAFEINPTNADLLKRSRKVFSRMKDADNVIRLSKRLINLEPSNYDVYKDIIELYLAMHKFDDALEYANKALELDKKDDVSLNKMIAKIYTYTGKAEEAVAIMKEKLTVDLTDIDSVQALAMAYCMAKDFPSGVKICLDAIEHVMPSEVAKLQNTISDIFAEQGTNLLAQGQTTEAFNKFSEAIQYNSENPEVYYKLTQANHKVKNFSESIKQCRRAIELAPENSKYYVYLGGIYEDLQNYIEAKKQYKEAVAIGPKNPQAHTKLGILQAKDNEFEAAIKSLKTAVSLDEKNPDILYNLALVYELSGDIDTAKQIYSSVLVHNPEHKETLNNLKILG